MGNKPRIALFEGDSPEIIATEFASKHSKYYINLIHIDLDN